MLCEICDGETWDNRQKKLDGTISPKAPDFKCKDDQCGWVKWPPKGTGGGTKQFKADPEKQSSIERQNSLTNAVAYCTAKASLMDKKEALEYLTGKQIVQVATHFHKYTKGDVTVVNPSGRQEVPEKQVDEVEDRNDDSAREYQPGSNEVTAEDIDSIPF